MKKSTIIIILIVYLASIVVIGFFGMKVKVYDKVLYVKTIEIEAQAEREEMFTLTPAETNGTSGENNSYTLMINFSQHHLIDGEGKAYLPIILMPHITYDTGDVAGENEKIVYDLVSNQDIEGLGIATLSERGELRCYKAVYSFSIQVRPEKSGLVGAGADIRVFII